MISFIISVAPIDEAFDTITWLTQIDKRLTELQREGQMQ